MQELADSQLFFHVNSENPPLRSTVYNVNIQCYNKSAIDVYNVDNNYCSYLSIRHQKGTSITYERTKRSRMAHTGKPMGRVSQSGKQDCGGYVGEERLEQKHNIADAAQNDGERSDFLR